MNRWRIAALGVAWATSVFVAYMMSGADVSAPPEKPPTDPVASSILPNESTEESSATTTVSADEHAEQITGLQLRVDFLERTVKSQQTALDRRTFYPEQAYSVEDLFNLASLRTSAATDRPYRGLYFYVTEKMWGARWDSPSFPLEQAAAVLEIVRRLDQSVDYMREVILDAIDDPEHVVGDIYEARFAAMLLSGIESDEAFTTMLDVLRANPVNDVMRIEDLQYHLRNLPTETVAPQAVAVQKLIVDAINSGNAEGVAKLAVPMWFLHGLGQFERYLRDPMVLEHDDGGFAVHFSNEIHTYNAKRYLQWLVRNHPIDSRRREAANYLDQWDEHDPIE